MILHRLIHIFTPLLVCGGVSLVIFFAISVAELVGKVRRRVRRRRRLRLEQYRAEQAIRRIRRAAVHDMLQASRAQHYAYDDPDIIEGAAVEVRH